VLCVRFDRRFAALTAQDFISELLVRRLACSSSPWAMISALALVARGFLVITESRGGIWF
jgi:hypothetical protein